MVLRQVELQGSSGVMMRHRHLLNTLYLASESKE